MFSCVYEALRNDPTPKGAIRASAQAPQIGRHDLSNTARLIQASFVLGMFRRVKDRHTLPHFFTDFEENLR